MEEEKIRNALELSISAGYQLDKEAFEFLRTLATTEDPTQIIGDAIQQMENHEHLKSGVGMLNCFYLKNVLEGMQATMFKVHIQDAGKPVSLKHIMILMNKPTL